MKKIKASLLFIFSFLVFAQINAQLTISKVFSDHCILQRNIEIPIYGTAKSKQRITVYFNGIKYKTKANKDGKWEVTIPSMTAGGPYSLDVLSKTDTISLLDILIGDIWLAGGQSNMEWFVEGAINAEMEIENANYPQIRIFDVPHRMSTTPKDQLESGKWSKVSSETIKQFSAVGYFFGRSLYNKLNIPIGILNNNWGGTVVQTWMSGNAFSGLPEYEKEVNELKNIDLEKQKTNGRGAFNTWLGDFHNLDKGIKNNAYIWANKNMNYSTWDSLFLPGLWELSGDTSLLNKDGVVWFQKDIILNVDSISENITLNLGAIDDSDKTWVNGILVGEMYNRYSKNRSYSIKKNVLKEGKNTIVVRVEDYTGAGGFTADPSNFYLEIGSTQINLSGTWKYKAGMFPKESLPKNIFGPNIFPSLLYNGMIHPIKKFPIKGVIWYQGESNTYNALEYRDLFKRWIKDWRNVWNNQTMPFLWVQLANYGNPPNKPKNSEWAELRESQDMALELPNTAMITAIDIGEGKNIHPKNKQEVGQRLSNAALNMAYNYEKIAYKGPRFLKYEMKDKYIVIEFDNITTKIEAKDKYGYVRGFTIAGEDKKFHWAKAYVIGDNKVKVWSDNVSKPMAVRYSWADNPEDSNLFDENNYPVFPFRTDVW